MSAPTRTAQLAFVGLGGMGAGMAHRLLDEGFELKVHNRTVRRAEPLAEAGATLAASAADAAAGADVVVLSLADEPAVEQVLFEQVLPVLAPGALVLNTSTVSPSYARSSAERLATAGVRPVEACVVGNPPMARSGQLRIFASGSREDVDAALFVLDVLGQQVLHIGAPGTASAMKLAFNLLLGAQTVALAEAVAFGVRAGLDRDLLISGIAESGFSSPVLAFRAEFMRSREYTPAAFRTSLMEKDLRSLLTDATGLGLSLPVTASVTERFAELIAAGDGDKDAAVVIESTG
jgi:3-hydroxyisobutyrate dehydrogenase-like beta-hydroxyacid dehydrogenase